MADNFYTAGLKVLLAQSFWTPPERKVLEFLLSKAEQSPAIYWDTIHERLPGSDLDVIIANIKSKCRYYQLAPVFEKLKEEYNA